MLKRLRHAAWWFAPILFSTLLVAQNPLTPGSCDGESTQHSAASRDSTYIKFINQTSHRVRVFWIDFQGQRRLYSLLDPGDSVEQQTYIGHLWAATDDGGKCLALYLATDQTSQALVRDSGRRSRP